MKWNADKAGGARPATHQGKYGDGGATRLTESTDLPLAGASNPTPHALPGWDKARRARNEWVKANVRPMLAVNQLSEEDLAALPPAVRAKAKELAAECGSLRAEGYQAHAQALAEESAAILEGMLPEDWSPPHHADEDDPAALAALIPRAGI